MTSRLGRATALAVALLSVHRTPDDAKKIDDAISGQPFSIVIDGPTFLDTIGWDWMPAVRDRDSHLLADLQLARN